MGMVQRVALETSFDATGKLVPAGHLGTFDEALIDPEKDQHLVDPSELPPTAMVQIAAIAPTGPNPQAPQQLPPGAVQGPGGGYFTPGKQLVGEVTRTAEDRIDNAGLADPDLETEVTEALAAIAEKRGLSVSDVQLAGMGISNAGRTTSTASSDASVDGTVADVTADLGGKTDEQLNAMLAAEKDGKNRTGVTNAIQAELDNRAEARENA